MGYLEAIGRRPCGECSMSMMSMFRRHCWLLARHTTDVRSAVLVVLIGQLRPDELGRADAACMQAAAANSQWIFQTPVDVNTLSLSLIGTQSETGIVVCSITGELLGEQSSSQCALKQFSSFSRQTEQYLYHSISTATDTSLPVVQHAEHKYYMEGSQGSSG
jgi:hypothetical protein